MKLHWSPKSPYVRKVMIAILERGLDGQIECVRSPVAITSPNSEVMRDNPLNKIPTLVRDNGDPLYDSMVICAYLDVLGEGPRLIPDRFEDRIETLRLHALANGLIDALILWRNERDRPEQARSRPHLDAYAFKVDATLDHLEAIEVARLGGRPFDLGQITLGTALGYADFRFAELGWRSTRPSLTTWFEGFSSRPSAQATAPFE